MIRGIELRRPWGARTSTLHCTHGHATEVPTDAAPSTCPVCDAAQAAPTAPVDLVAVLAAHVQVVHPYTDDCDCAACADCRAILDARVDVAMIDAELDADAHLFCVDADAVRADLDADASLSTRDDGALYHGRLPSDDDDVFTPWITAGARAPERGARVLYTLPHAATPTHRPWCVTPYLRYGWCDCTLDARVS